MNNLNVKAKHSYDALKKSIQWASESKNLEISENQRLIKNLKYSLYKIKNLQKAANSRACIGAYGASQAGKSYMVSTLARKKNTKLIANMGPFSVDFLEHINPPGGQESTGLVTRFTIQKYESPEGFPIKVKLLSEIDLVKILLNSYAFDILSSEDEDIEIHKKNVENLLLEFDEFSLNSESPIQLEDVFGLEDYCNASQFSSNFRVQALKKTRYWSRLTELLPILPLNLRIKIYGALWENLDIYSGILNKLLNEINSLGNPEVVYCSPETLFTNTNGIFARSKLSIINVSALDGLAIEYDSYTNINVNNKIFKINTSLLSSLVAELVISIKESPSNLFDSTDLLDFPGARTRNTYPKNLTILSDPKVIVQNFLRGKVAYLFDKYSNNYEISAMLLCVGPSVQEVSGLDRLIDSWVAKTHGIKMESRDNLPSSLFLILTKFDQEFSLNSGLGLNGDRWTTRIQSSLIQPFASHSHITNWVNKWNSLGAFKNLFWLRNPSHEQLGLIEYETNSVGSLEVGISPAKKSAVDILRKSFLENLLVRQHFKDPELAWDAGMSLNDGGASYLISNISPVCNSDVKNLQISQRIDEITNSILNDLSKFFISSDFEDVKKEKIEFAFSFLENSALMLQNNKLGEFISKILVNDSDTETLYRNLIIDFEKKNLSNKSHGTLNPSSVIRSDLIKRLGLNKSENNHIDTSTLIDKSLSFPDKFLIDFFQIWRSNVLASCGNSESSYYLQIKMEIVSKLLVEIEISVRNSGLYDELKKIIEQNFQYKGADKNIWIKKQTCSITALFNEFICHGCHYNFENSGLSICGLDNQNIVIFKNNSDDPINFSLPNISDDSSDNYFIDWLQGIQASVISNCDYRDGLIHDFQSNNFLGQILNDLNLALES